MTRRKRHNRSQLQGRLVSQASQAPAMPSVIVRKSREEQAATQDAERMQVLASLRASLLEMAGLERDASFAADAQTSIAMREAQDALSTLTRLTPDVLARMPDLAGQLHDVARLADERLHARGGGASPTATAPQLDLVRTSPTGSTPVAAGNAAGWAGTGISGVRHDAMGVPNADYLRRLATKNPWVQAAITTRKQQIGRADITVMPDDPLAPFDASIQDAVDDLLNYPNELKDSYRSLVEPVIDDILALDRGCISKDLDARGIPHHLYVEDGATIRIFADWQGDPNQPRYLFVPPGSAPGIVGSQQGVTLYNDQLLCIMANAASYRFGLAPTQVLLDTIRGDLAATEKAMALVRDVPPPHLVNVKTSAGSGVGQKVIDGIRTEYERRIAGQREIMFLGADDLQVFPLMFSLKDNQFLEWQTYLARKICAVFQISPQQIGITFDINKATAESQQDIFEDSGLLPLMLLLEEFFNRELLADFAPKRRADNRPDMRRLNLRVFFPEVSELARMRHAERVIKTVSGALGGLPLFTPNQAMEMLGREPMPGGNRFWVNTATAGVLPTPLGYDDDFGDWPLNIALGEQDPAGGVDEDEARQRTEDEQGKPTAAAEGADQSANSASGETTAGNETTGSGDQPNLSDAESNPVSQGQGNSGGGSGSAGKSAALPKRAALGVRKRAPQVPVWLLRVCDARRPGTPWSPAADSLTRERAQRIAAAGGFPGSYTSGFSLNEVEREGDATPLLRLVAPAEVVTAKAVSEDESELRHPKPVGRVSAGVAAAHTPPYKQREAAAQLATEVRAIFEQAQRRGQHAG